MALKRECDRCHNQSDAKEEDTEAEVSWPKRGGAWGRVNAYTVGDEYGFKMGNDLCNNCWRLLRENFMNGLSVPAIRQEGVTAQ